MDSQPATVTHYAILIEIDNYPEKPLKNYVHNVQGIKTYLKGTLEDSLQIQAFTAGHAKRKPSNPAHDPTLWPTRENVTSAFKKVTSLAKARDFVYIHYSGHNTQKPSSSEFSNGSSDDLTLVLLSRKRKKQVNCLWGFELAGLLKSMVNNGIIITLVLNCYFSASVYRRNNPSTRFLPYCIKMDSRSLLNIKKTPKSVRYHDTSMQPNWLIKPDRYTILTACGPHEKTIGRKFNGKNYGALSYILLKTVKCIGLTRRHKDVHSYVRAKFKGLNFQKTPVLYENQNQNFFGQVSSNITKADIPIIVRQNNTLELQAGYAHGVKIDDQLVLYLLDFIESDPRSQKQSADAKVSNTKALTSKLELSSTPSIPPQTEWVAKALTRSTLQKFPIQLSSELSYQDDWLIALKDRSLNIHINSENHPFAINVVSNKGKCEIPNEKKYEIIDLTNIPQDQTGISQIKSILQHLARFRLVRDLVNKTSADPFQETFEVQIINNKKSFGPDYLIEIKHNAIAELIMKNKKDKDLYIFVYNLSPCWQVKNAYHKTNIIVRPQSNEQQNKPTRKKFKIMILKRIKEKGYHSYKDILKVFVTSQPTSFDLLELSKLGERAKTSAADKTGQEKGNELKNWATVNFPIFTSLQRNASIQ